MRKTAHKQTRFLNCLRIGIVPGHYEEQRIENIITFCKKYKFDNVMLFINNEEYNVGHMTKEEAVPWLTTIKRAKKALVDAGITVSLNPWMELGHLDRGRKLKEGQDFVTQVDFNGRQCDISVCPMDENWLTYFLDFYEYLIREVEPETIWVEDDFRLHNHGPLEYGGCFCEHHMRAFNEKLGTNYSRDEFLDRLYRKNPDKEVQKAFLEVNRECMASLAEKIGEMIQSLGLGTRVALMSSGHPSHSMEYRDWHRMLKGFAQDGPMINRTNLPMYEERNLKEYYQVFNEAPFICRGFLPKECHVLPELENGAFMTWSKEPETLRFQVESALPLEIEGMTYDIFDFAANGTIEAFGYGQEIGGITDYLTAVMNSGYSYWNLSGITIPLDEKNAYNRPIKDSFFDMRPDEAYFGALLQGHGISARCSKEKTFHDEVVVLGAGNVYNFTDEQLVSLFADNHIIVDGKAVMLLVERGLGELLAIDKYELYDNYSAIHSYEQVAGDELINDIPGYRASAFARLGHYIAITYKEQPCIKSNVFDYLGNFIAPGIVVSKGHLIVPYVVDDFYSGILHPLRQKYVCDYIDELGKAFVRTDYSNIYAYYSKGENNVLILVNPTVHTLPKTRFKMVGEIVERVYEIQRDGVQAERSFSIDKEGFIVIEEPHLELTTKTFVLETRCV